MKKKSLFSALLLIGVISLTAILNSTNISAEEATELPKAENLTAEEFIEACKSGSAKAVKDLLADKKLSPNVQLKWAEYNDYYSPLLFLAVRKSTNTDVIQTLIDLGADIHIQSDDVFNEAADSVSPDIMIPFFLKKGFDPNIKNKNGYPALIRVASNVNDDEGLAISAMIEAGVNVNAQNEEKGTLSSGRTALMAARRGKIIKKLLDAGADVNIKNEAGETALFEAILGDEEGVRLLLQAGADPNASNDKGATVLIHAVGYDVSAAKIKLLLSASADVNARMNDGTTALINTQNAIMANNFEALKVLIEAGADVNAQKDDGTTALIAAKTFNAIKILVEAGADVNISRKDGKTALMNAVERDFNPYSEPLPDYDLSSPSNKGAIDLLLKAGANINAEMNDGTTALMLACASNRIIGNEVLVKTLIKAGANVNARTKDGLTALINAAGENGTINFVNPVIPVLLEAGADINATMTDGTTALVNAAKNGQEKNFEELLKAGANPNVTLSNGKTLLILAAENARMPEMIIEKLVTSVDVNTKDDNGNTALLALLKNYAQPDLIRDSLNRTLGMMSSVRAVNDLIKAGADVNIQNNEGMTALIYATSADIQPLVLTLLAAGADASLKSNDGTAAKIDAQKLLIELKRNIVNPLFGDLSMTADYSAIVKVLVKEGIDINARDENGWPLLFLAVAKKNDDSGELSRMEEDFKANHVVRGLIEGGANVNVTGGKANITPIMQAVFDNSTQIIKVLAEKGANLELRDNDGETPLFMAIRNGELETVNALIESGANINARNNRGVTALITACINENAQNNPQILRELLHAGASVNARDDKLGGTALIFASVAGDNPEIIRALLEAGADPNLTSNEGGRAIDYIRHNDKLNRTEAVDMLINAMNPSNRFNSGQTTPRNNSSSAANIDVFKLAERGTPEQLKEALNNGARFNVSRTTPEDGEEIADDWYFPDGGETPLHHAAAYNHNSESIRFLIAQGIDVNAVAENGRTLSETPLSRAIRYKNLEAVQELLKAGADPNFYSLGETSNGSMLQIAAIEYTDDDYAAKTVINVLIEAGANVNEHYEAESWEKKQMLLPRSQWTSSNPLWNLKDDLSYAETSNFVPSCTPLISAVINDNPSVVNILLDNKADANLTNIENKTALDYANELPGNSKLKTSPVFNRLKNATTVASKAIKSDPNFDRADMLVAQGKIPMYVRDKGIFVYNPKMKMVRITGKNVRLRSQPNVNANVIDRSNYGWWGSIEYLGEWTHPNGDKWIVGIYDNWNYHPEPTPEWEKKVIWVSAKYARPITMEEYWSWQSTIERAD